MFAMVGVHRFDPAGFERQERMLHERIVPMIRHQPGFVSGAWSCDRGAGRYHSFLVFETETAARKLGAALRSQSAGEVALESLIVTEILASTVRP